MSDNKDNNEKESVQLSFTADKEDADKFKERVGNMSGSFREILRSWNEVEEKHDIDDDMQRINEIVLKTYINALAKNISLLENEKEKLEEKLEDVQEEEPDEEVIVKLDLNMNEKGYE